MQLHNIYGLVTIEAFIIQTFTFNDTLESLHAHIHVIEKVYTTFRVYLKCWA